MLDTLEFPNFTKGLGVRLLGTDLMKLSFRSTIESEHVYLGTEVDEERVRGERDPCPRVANDHGFDNVRVDLGVRAVHLV